MESGPVATPTAPGSAFTSSFLNSHLRTHLYSVSDAAPPPTVVSVNMKRISSVSGKTQGLGAAFKALHASPAISSQLLVYTCPVQHDSLQPHVAIYTAVGENEMERKIQFLDCPGLVSSQGLNSHLGLAAIVPSNTDAELASVPESSIRQH